MERNFKKLKVGKTYLNLQDNKVIIIAINGEDGRYLGDSGLYYRKNGKMFSGCKSDEDLILFLEEQLKEDSSFENLIDPIKPKHYQMAISPLKFIIKNKIGFIEGNIIKYLTRYKSKNGKEDLRKAKEYLKHLINNYED